MRKLALYTITAAVLLTTGCGKQGPAAGPAPASLSSATAAPASPSGRSDYSKPALNDEMYST